LTKVRCATSWYIMRRRRLCNDLPPLDLLLVAFIVQSNLKSTTNNHSPPLHRAKFSQASSQNAINPTYKTFFTPSSPSKIFQWRSSAAIFHSQTSASTPLTAHFTPKSSVPYSFQSPSEISHTAVPLVAPPFHRTKALPQIAGLHWQPLSRLWRAHPLLRSSLVLARNARVVGTAISNPR